MYDINSITYTLEIALTTQYGKIREKFFNIYAGERL